MATAIVCTILSQLYNGINCIICICSMRSKYNSFECTLTPGFFPVALRFCLVFFSFSFNCLFVSHLSRGMHLENACARSCEWMKKFVRIEKLQFQHRAKQMRIKNWDKYWIQLYTLHTLGPARSRTKNLAKKTQNEKIRIEKREEKKKTKTEKPRQWLRLLPLRSNINLRKPEYIIIVGCSLYSESEYISRVWNVQLKRIVV